MGIGSGPWKRLWPRFDHGKFVRLATSVRVGMPSKEASDKFLDKIKLDMPSPVCRNGS
jgi:hypothetical protein